MDSLPIFPLRTVLYPGLVMPLHIFEERYLQLVGHLLTLPEEQRRFGVVAIRQGSEVGEAAARGNRLHQVGCVAAVRDIEELDDGQFSMVTIGRQRFRLHSVDASGRYLHGEVELLDEPTGDPAPSLAQAVSAAFTTYRAVLTGKGEELDLLDDPTLLSYVVAAAAILDLSDKQALLEAPVTATRLRHELMLLRREISVVGLLPSLPAVELAGTESSSN